MRGRGTVVALSLGKSHLTSGASVRPENSFTYTYSTDKGSQKICGVFSETSPLQRSTISSIESHLIRTVDHFLREARMRTSTSLAAFALAALSTMLMA